jgi:hypothetical protein
MDGGMGKAQQKRQCKSERVSTEYGVRITDYGKDYKGGWLAGVWSIGGLKSAKQSTEYGVQITEGRSQ